MTDEVTNRMADTIRQVDTVNIVDTMELCVAGERKREQSCGGSRHDDHA